MPRKRTDPPPSLVVELEGPPPGYLPPVPYTEQDVADVRRYLKETGLSLENILAAMNLENTPDFPHARERLTADELATLKEVGQAGKEIRDWVWRERRAPGTVHAPAILPEAERVAILETLADLPPLPFDGARELDMTHEVNIVFKRARAVAPTYNSLLERREPLDAKARLTPAELRERIAARLTRPDGTVGPSPAEWCHANGLDFAAFRQVLYLEWFEQGRKRLEKAEAILAAAKRPSAVRVGTATISTFNADKHTVKKASRKQRVELTKIDEEARRLFLEEDYTPLSGYERVVVMGLANLAWDEGLLEAVPAARSARRIINLDKPNESEDALYVRFRFPGYAEMARRLGAPTDEEGRIPQNFTRAIERAFGKLSSEARWIGERVLVKRGKADLSDDFVVRKGLWIQTEQVGTSGEVFVLLHAAACTAMLASYVERPDLLAQYEHARKAIGAGKLRDDFVACEDYLRYRLQAKKAKPKHGVKVGEIPAPQAGATEADRGVVVEVRRELLWQKMGWDEEAKKRGRKEAMKREVDALAFCRELGLLIGQKERAAPGGKVVLVLTLAGSKHPDPLQGTLFLPEAGT